MLLDGRIFTNQPNKTNMELFVTNETSELESVILGIGIDRGKPRGINPMMRKHLSNNTFPTEDNICAEIKTFEDVLKQHQFSRKCH